MKWNVASKPAWYQPGPHGRTHGQEYDEDILNSDHEFAPGVDQFTMVRRPPRADKAGKYQMPMPGMTTKREY